MQTTESPRNPNAPKTIFDLPETERYRRGMTTLRACICTLFVALLTIPIISYVIGMFALLMLFVRVLAISTRRGKDTLWLLLGALLCIVGWTFPFIFASSGGFSGGGLFCDALLNMAVCRFILLGPLEHIMPTRQADV